MSHRVDPSASSGARVMERIVCSLVLDLVDVEAFLMHIHDLLDDVVGGDVNYLLIHLLRTEEVVGREGHVDFAALRVHLETHTDIAGDHNIGMRCDITHTLSCLLVLICRYFYDSRHVRESYREFVDSFIGCLLDEETR